MIVENVQELIVKYLARQFAKKAKSGYKLAKGIQ